MLRGKRKGDHAKVVQFCNDWVTGDFDDGAHLTAGLMSVRLDAAEVAMFRESSNVGTMWREFSLSDDGRFTRRTPVESS